jgi:thioredoxin-dependent peroxiredoxin
MFTRIAFVLTAIAVGFTASALAEPKVGDAAPGVAATDQFGRQVTLQEFRSHKYVVLYFYPKDFTAGCTLEAQRFAEDYPQFASRDAAIIGISKDPVASHKDFCAKYELPFTLLADPDGQIAQAFGAGDKYDRRSTFVIDKGGKIVHILPKVADIQGQNQALLAELDKAGATRIGPQVGKHAPDVLLPAQSSDQVWTLSSQKGHTVVLTFYRGWVGYQCPNCVRQAKALDAAAADFDKAGVKLATIYAGTPDQAAEFAGKTGLKSAALVSFLLDEHRQAAYAYNVLTDNRKEVRPATFVIDKDGVIRWAYIGKSAGDRPSPEIVLAEARKAAKAPSTQKAGQ